MHVCVRGHWYSMWCTEHTWTSHIWTYGVKHWRSRVNERPRRTCSVDENMGFWRGNRFIAQNCDGAVIVGLTHDAEFNLTQPEGGWQTRFGLLCFGGNNEGPFASICFKWVRDCCSCQRKYDYYAHWVRGNVTAMNGFFQVRQGLTFVASAGSYSRKEDLVILVIDRMFYVAGWSWKPLPISNIKLPRPGSFDTLWIGDLNSYIVYALEIDLLVPN